MNTEIQTVQYYTSKLQSDLDFFSDDTVEELVDRSEAASGTISFIRVPLRHFVQETYGIDIEEAPEGTALAEVWDRLRSIFRRTFKLRKEALSLTADELKHDLTEAQALASTLPLLMGELMEL